MTGSVVSRWKKCFLVLYVDGIVRCFDNENSHLANKTSHMNQCQRIDYNVSINSKVIKKFLP